MTPDESSALASAREYLAEMRAHEHSDPQLAVFAFSIIPVVPSIPMK